LQHKFFEDAEKLKGLVNEYLWNEKLGWFDNYYPDGTKGTIWTYHLFDLLALLLLSVMAIVINSIALVAIISRVTEGLAPNRTIVLITNLLVFINLIVLTVKL